MTLKMLPVFGLLSLAACSTGETQQQLLTQTVYNVESTYTIAGEATLPFLKGQVPGVKIDAQDKELIQKASATMFNEIQSLKNSINNKEPLSITAVNALQTDLNSFLSCWTRIKENQGTDDSACHTLTDKDNEKKS